MNQSLRTKFQSTIKKKKKRKKKTERKKAWLNISIRNRKLEFGFQPCYIKEASRVRVAYLKELNHQFFTITLNKFLKHVFNILLKLSNHT